MEHYGQQGKEQASFDETPDATPQRPTTEHIINDFAAMLARALQDITRTNLQDTRAPLQTFAGLEQENPTTFIARLREHFVQNRIQTDEDRVAIAAKQLRGDAARWFAPYTTYPITFEEFEDKIANRYDSSSARAVIKAKLYGDRQKEGESVGIFITRKRALFNRVEPDVVEDVAIHVILELLRPQIKAHLRGHTFANIEEFTRTAEQIEEDLREPVPQTTRRPVQPQPTRYINPPTPSQGPVQRPQNTNVSQQASANDTPVAGPSNRAPPRTPPTPCRYCGAWHYHIACPRNPYKRPGNEQRVGRDQTAQPASATVRGPTARPTTNQQ